MRCFGIRRELDPSATQLVRLAQAVGSVRFAQNACLSEVKRRMDSGVQQSWSSFSLHTLWRDIRADVAPWYAENSKECYQFGAERLSAGLMNFSKSRNGKRAGRKVGFPSFRSRGVGDSVKFTAARTDGAMVSVPRIGDIRLKEAFAIPDGMRLTAVTIRPKVDRWFVTFHVRQDDWEAPRKVPIRKTAGVDLGVGNNFAAISDGTVIPNPRFYRTDAVKLRRAQKSVSRKTKGSANRRRAIQKVQKVHFSIANRRADFIHKFTSSLVESQDEIVIEDLCVTGMGRALKLGKSVHDAAMAETRRQLAYKCEWYGKTLTVVDRWYPSSKTCSACGVVNKDLTLKQRHWTCECGANHHRDLNAAYNLAASSAVSACGDGSAGRIRPTKLLPAKQEPNRAGRQ